MSKTARALNSKDNKDIKITLKAIERQKNLKQINYRIMCDVSIQPSLFETFSM